jgi:hypothetical protein
MGLQYALPAIGDRSAVRCRHKRYTGGGSVAALARELAAGSGGMGVSVYGSNYEPGTRDRSTSQSSLDYHGRSGRYQRDQRSGSNRPAARSRARRIVQIFFVVPAPDADGHYARHISNGSPERGSVRYRDRSVRAARPVHRSLSKSRYFAAGSFCIIPKTWPSVSLQ